MPRMLKLGTDMNSGQMDHLYSCTGLSCPAADCFVIFVFFIFLSLQISNIKNFHRPFSGTVRPRRLKTCYTHEHWVDVSYIPESGCCCLFMSLLIFLSLQFSNIKNFVTLFSGIVSPRKLKLATHVNSGWMYLFISQNRLLLLICPFISFFFPIF